MAEPTSDPTRTLDALLGTVPLSVDNGYTHDFRATVSLDSFSHGEGQESCFLHFSDSPTVPVLLYVDVEQDIAPLVRAFAAIPNVRIYSSSAGYSTNGRVIRPCVTLGYEGTDRERSAFFTRLHDFIAPWRGQVVLDGGRDTNCSGHLAVDRDFIDCLTHAIQLWIPT